MNKVTESEIIDNLNKWKDICTLMESKRDIVIINEIIKRVNNANIVETKSGIAKKKKESDKEKLINILNAFNSGDSKVIKDYKLDFIKLDINIQEEWDKLSDYKKNKLTKLELNVIYSMLYRPAEISYINKTKTEIVRNINYFIKDEKRDKAIRESNLI